MSRGRLAGVGAWDDRCGCERGRCGCEGGVGVRGRGGGGRSHVEAGGGGKVPLIIPADVRLLQTHSLPTTSNPLLNPRPQHDG
jgi:hypothetical protein